MLVIGRLSDMRLCSVWFIVSVLLVSVLLVSCMLLRYFVMCWLLSWYLLLGMLVVDVLLVMMYRCGIVCSVVWIVFGWMCSRLGMIFVYLVCVSVVLMRFGLWWCSGDIVLNRCVKLYVLCLSVVIVLL